MRELYPYYERELSFMREMAGEFARNFPETAGRLDIERHRCEDPHVERLIEAFCLVAARIHQRLDSDFPEITQSLLNLVFPHYLRPIPSMSIAQFRWNPNQALEAKAIAIEPGQQLSVGDVCSFRTCFPVEVWPIELQTASLLDAADLPPWAASSGSSGGILIHLKCDLGFKQVKDLRKLRFWLDGSAHVPFSLYELIFNRCRAVLLRNPNTPAEDPIDLTASCLYPVGFDQKEGVLPYETPSFLGFRSLHEYFSFPEKFLFFDLCDLEVLSGRFFEQNAQVLLLFDDQPNDDKFQRMRHSVGSDNFQLGCTPALNLFTKYAEPIRVDQLRSEYRVIPDSYHPSSTEVYSIDQVSARSFSTRTTRIYRQFFDFRHSEAEPGEACWHAVRRRSERRGDAGTEVFISLLDQNFQPKKPPDETLLVKVTCTNRDLPAELAIQHTYDLRQPDPGSASPPPHSITAATA